ncbi:hypothetical protein QJS10_CPA01g02855 [Acorus calamus]|uniref:Lon protease homolog n=1 Tax=Acorus calamus TaxID=4465 RepID=A0AAV9FFB8_ACOCL|nr:hypothetical protein QJS10_CPA01g02855 [Acorus calamus]
MEQELWQREKKGLIGVLAVRDVKAASVPATGGGTNSGEQGKQDGKNQRKRIEWCQRGVAARALHIFRNVEKPSGRVTYTVVLEGLCRFSVQELSTGGTYCTARVSHLKLTKPELEQAEQDPELITLSRQFKATAMELISVREKEQKTVFNCKDLETLPVHLLADAFVSSFEMSFEDQISMLYLDDLKGRLSKANELVERHLQSFRVEEKITQKVEGQLSIEKEFPLREQKRAIKEELDDNDDDEDEDDVAALQRKMQNAEMPPNVWKHAQRELRQLRKMEPQQPGYSSSRVYLELLADLPWQKASEEHQLNLRAAKERLDSDHYGVGKTSLASSIAAALGRKFLRASLGGVKDEADIRGHRRTYLGSMPGRLIEGFKTVGVNNPVMLLDEIDKLGTDVRGDPASALLEVLDPEQNKTFNDQAQLIPPPLLDRMEVIELPGYTPEEKLRIAMQHLIPKVLDQHGLSSDYLQIPEPPIFDDRETSEHIVAPGITVGLVWTSFGGEVQFVEAIAMAGKGELHLTGQLGDVIKESAHLALTWVRSRVADLKISGVGEMNLLENRDIHIHFPAGAVPKDGPSAGVTLVTSLVSLFSQKKVRSDTAMTGEMTLRGLVLPVGGIKDKVLAAHRHGIKRVILPQRNLKDLVEIPQSVIAGMEILLVKRIEDVLEQAFEGGNPWKQQSKL